MPIYYDMSWDEYRGRSEMNPSTLKHGTRSMKRLWRAISGECQPNPQTVAVGNAVHCMIAGELEERFAIMPAFEDDDGNRTAKGDLPKNPKATAYYKAKKAEWESGNTKDTLTAVQVATAAKIANEIRNNNEARKLLESSSHEVVVTGVIAGVPMKTRLDGLTRDNACVWDIKTTQDASDEAFYRVYKRLKYGFSAAVHLILLKQNGIELPDYKFVVAETGDDYDVRVITVPLIAITNQTDAVEGAAKAYRQAAERGEWPGLGNGEMYIPNWDMIEEPELEWSDA